MTRENIQTLIDELAHDIQSLAFQYDPTRSNKQDCSIHEDPVASTRLSRVSDELNHALKTWEGRHKSFALPPQFNLTGSRDQALEAKEHMINLRKKVCKGTVLKTPALLRPDQQNPLFNQQRIFVNNRKEAP